ncbi:MAG: cistern family PEP-CTERM protein, partial [Phormidium sp.]
MRSSCFNSFLPAVLSTASIALVSPIFTAPANAYGVYLNGKTAGNPGDALYDVNIVSPEDVGRQLDPVKWLVPAGTKGDTILPVDLTAQANITVDSLTSNLLKMSVTLSNTTQGYTSSILGFGFGVSPDATSVRVNGSTIFDTAIIQKGQQQFTGGFKQIDVCIYAVGCNGGDVKEGLQSGQSTTFTLEISGNFWDSALGKNSVTLSDFPIKFQTGSGSFEPAGVPEPITVFGSGLALG